MRECNAQRMTESTNVDTEDRDDHEEEEEEEEEEIEEEVEEEIEVEVEEEIEVEEEVEVEEYEEEEQQKDSNEDSHKLNLSHQDKSDDVSQDMEIGEDDEIIELHPAPEKSDPRLPSCSLVDNSGYSCNDSGALNGSLEMQGEVCVNDKNTKFPIVENYLVTAEQNGNLASASYAKGTETSNKEKYKECDEPNGNREACSCINVASAEMNNACCTKEKDSDDNLTVGDSLVPKINNFFHSNDEIQPISVQSDTRTRRLSPSAEIQDRNKRSARVCDFFAKGWCIRGSSCTFLHIKDKTDNGDQQLEGDGTNLTREDQFDEGLANIMEKSKTFGLPNKKGSSVQKDDVLSCHLSSGRTLPLENEENKRPWLLEDKHKMLLFRRLDLSPHFYGGNPSSHSSSLIYLNGNEDLHQRNPSLYASVLSSGMLASHGLSNWTGSFSSFHPSMNRSPTGSQKLHNAKDCCVPRSSSLLQCASPLSVSDCQSKTKISPNDWELSAPFRPSFVITPATSSPSGQYDPFRDCIDQPSSGNKSFRFYFLSQGTSSMNASHQPLHGDDRSSGSFYDKVHDNSKEKVCHTPGKASFTAGIEDGADSVVDGDGQNWATPAEENASGTDPVKDSPSKNEVSFVRESRNQINWSKKKAKGNRIKQNNDIEVDQKLDETMQKEPKALRCFRSALIEFVKELLKPVWHEGHLSKDAHNTIVKKTVEKVVRTMQYHQIPATLELTKLYLSSSQPKIAKLVGAYLEKYGKS